MEVECTVRMNGFAAFIAKWTAVITVARCKLVFCFYGLFKRFFWIRSKKRGKAKVVRKTVIKSIDDSFICDCSKSVHTLACFFVVLSEGTCCRRLRTIQANHLFFFFIHDFVFLQKKHSSGNGNESGRKILKPLCNHITSSR